MPIGIWQCPAFSPPSVDRSIAVPCYIHPVFGNPYNIIVGCIIRGLKCARIRHSREIRTFFTGITPVLEIYGNLPSCRHCAGRNIQVLYFYCRCRGQSKYKYTGYYNRYFFHIFFLFLKHGRFILGSFLITDFPENNNPVIRPFYVREINLHAFQGRIRV